MPRMEKRLTPREIPDLELDRLDESINLAAPAMLPLGNLRNSSAFACLDSEGYVSASVALADASPQSLAEEYYRQGPFRSNSGGQYSAWVETALRAKLSSIFTPSNGTRPLANVQPLSGTLANLAVILSTCHSGDTILSISPATGGHISQGQSDHPLLSKMFRFEHLVLRSEEYGSLYDDIAQRCRSTRPRLVFIGCSSFPHDIHWDQVFEAISRTAPRPVLVADMAHTAGLVASALYSNPLDFADVATLVWYKTLGGPRGGALLSTSTNYFDPIAKMLHPGLQGSPSVEAMYEALSALEAVDSGSLRKLLHDAKAIAGTAATIFSNLGWRISYGGTSSHMLILECNEAELVAFKCESIGVHVNPTTVMRADRVRTALRLGFVQFCQRGFGLDELASVAECITKCATGELSEVDRAALRACIQSIAVSATPHRALLQL